MKKREELTKLLVVVDMVNGFIKEGKMSDKDINHITPRIKSLVESFLSDEEGVAFIKDTHEVNSTEFKKYPPHCLKGTSESELISELSDERGWMGILSVWFNGKFRSESGIRQARSVSKDPFDAVTKSETSALPPFIIRRNGIFFSSMNSILARLKLPRSSTTPTER